MKINEWQAQNKISNTKLANLLKIHPSYITHLKAGRRNWTPKLAEAMEVLSDGEVPRLQLLYPDSTQKIKLHTTFVHKVLTLFSWGKPPKT